MYREAVGWAFTALLISSSLVGTFSYPNVQINSPSSPSHPPTVESRNFYPVKGPRDIPEQRNERKFAEKPNHVKKVALERLDDIETNSIAESSPSAGGFSWSSLLGMLMQMIFNPGGANQGPSKSEVLEDGPIQPASPWANLLSVGLKILTAILGGGNTGGDGIDKVDNGNSPMQFINIVVNLLDALKTSFSHRSMAARHLGRKDSISDAATASLSMVKGYLRSLKTGDTKCMERYICQANTECSKDIGQSSVYCHLGSYAVSYILEKSVGSPSFDVFYEAGRRGRYGDNCQEKYLECNEV